MGLHFIQKEKKTVHSRWENKLQKLSCLKYEASQL